MKDPEPTSFKADILCLRNIECTLHVLQVVRAFALLYVLPSGTLCSTKIHRPTRASACTWVMRPGLGHVCWQHILQSLSRSMAVLLQCLLLQCLLQCLLLQCLSRSMAVLLPAPSHVNARSQHHYNNETPARSWKQLLC